MKPKHSVGSVATALKEGLLSGAILLRGSDEEPLAVNSLTSQQAKSRAEQELLERELHERVEQYELTTRELDERMKRQRSLEHELDLLRREQQQQRNLLGRMQELVQTLELHPERPLEQLEKYDDLDPELQRKLREYQNLQKRLLEGRRELRDQMLREMQQQQKLLELGTLRIRET